MVCPGIPPSREKLVVSSVLMLAGRKLTPKHNEKPLGNKLDRMTDQ
jgi:hypothetical protein